MLSFSPRTFCDTWEQAALPLFLMAKGFFSLAAAGFFPFSPLPFSKTIEDLYGGPPAFPLEQKAFFFSQ